VEEGQRTEGLTAVDRPRVKTQKTGGLLSIDTSDFKMFASGLRKANPQLARAFRKDLRKGAEIVAIAARSKASWSSQIPGQIKTGGSGASTWVDVTNSARSSGSGRVAIEFEMGNKSYKGRRYGVFKHPVFNSTGQPSFAGKGDRAYYEQRTQSYGTQRRHTSAKRYGTGVGWSEQKLRPYLRPAFEEHQAEILEIVRATIYETLRKI
jgi:hypothetical protein